MSGGCSACCCACSATTGGRRRRPGDLPNLHRHGQRFRRQSRFSTFLYLRGIECRAESAPQPRPPALAHRGAGAAPGRRDDLPSSPAIPRTPPRRRDPAAVQRAILTLRPPAGAPRAVRHRRALLRGGRGGDARGGGDGEVADPPRPAGASRALRAWWTTPGAVRFRRGAPPMTHATSSAVERVPRGGPLAPGGVPRGPPRECAGWRRSCVRCARPSSCSTRCRPPSPRATSARR